MPLNAHKTIVIWFFSYYIVWTGVISHCNVLQCAISRELEKKTTKFENVTLFNSKSLWSALIFWFVTMRGLHSVRSLRQHYWFNVLSGGNVHVHESALFTSFSPIPNRNYSKNNRKASYIRNASFDWLQYGWQWIVFMRFHSNTECMLYAHAKIDFTSFSVCLLSSSLSSISWSWTITFTHFTIDNQ